MMLQRSLLGLGVALAAAATGLLGCADTTYVFDGVVVGDDDSGREPRARSNSQFIRAIYADLLGRTPETYDFVVTQGGAEVARFPIDEQRTLLTTLEGVGDPAPMRALLVAGLVHSSEAKIPAKDEVADPRQFIRDQFRTFLGREPGVYELDAFVAEWESDPAVNPRTIIRALVESREYQSF